MEYYKPSKKRGISYIPRRDGRLTGLIILCVETAFYNTLLKEKVEGRTVVLGRRGIRRKQLLGDIKEAKGYWNLKD
jgi:hypothetical protein